MGENFIGPGELGRIRDALGIRAPTTVQPGIPLIPYGNDLLDQSSRSHILILGAPSAFDGSPLTINKMRSFHGTDPSRKEPCFYNQDWYLGELFAKDVVLRPGWYLIGKYLLEPSRGKEPATKKTKTKLPSAVLACFAFFAYYFQSGGQKLWDHDYIWCSDVDHNGDQIYVGKYTDPSGINKSGFNIHRHLKIKDNYGCIDLF